MYTKIIFLAILTLFGINHISAEIEPVTLEYHEIYSNLPHEINGLSKDMTSDFEREDISKREDISMNTGGDEDLGPICLFGSMLAIGAAIRAGLSAEYIEAMSFAFYLGCMFMP